MADLANIASHNATLDILHPGTGEAIGLRLELVPPDSAEIKQEVRRLHDMRRHKAARNQPISAADNERATIALCSRAIVGWTWTNDANGDMGSWNGEQPEHNPTTKAEMLSRDWLRNQIDQFMGLDASFY